MGARTVRRICALCRELGTRRGVARRLAEDGITTPRGYRWRAQQVRQVPMNPVYTGARFTGSLLATRPSTTRSPSGTACLH
jgi:hypothetical protein